MACKEYLEVVSRNVACARACLSLEKARAFAEEEDSPRDHEGNIIAETSGDELIPRVAYDAPLSQTLFPASGPARNSSGNPATP